MDLYALTHNEAEKIITGEHKAPTFHRERLPSLLAAADERQAGKAGQAVYERKKARAALIFFLCALGSLCLRLAL